MKIIIKKNSKNFLEEARTFQDATTNVGKYRKKLINKLRNLEKEQPEQLADEIIENMKNSIEEKFGLQGKMYTLPDGERVAVFDWLKNLTIENKNDLIKTLSEGELEDIEKIRIAQFILSKKFTGVKSVAEFEDLVDLLRTTTNAWKLWKDAEQRKREKESLKSSDQNIEELASPDQNWEIFIPQDKQASIYLGQICRSNWCTSARSEKNMFSRYHREDDPLFVIKHKTKQETAVVKNPQTQEIEEVSVPMMFQVHFGTKQFMDRKDDDIGKGKTFLTLLEIIKNSKTADGKSIKEKYPIVDTVSAFKTEKGIQTKTIDGHGTKEWYLNGELHRENGPAVEYTDGRKEWFLDGKRHREDGPAIEKEDGSKEWYLNGELHREDGPAVEYADGQKEWYLNGKRHREDGPAVYGGTKFGGVQSDSKQWYLNGELHREDGPAIEDDDGTKRWVLNGRRLGRTGKNDFSTPPGFIQAGGKEWDWRNDPWLNKSKIKTELKEHFQRFRKLWL